MRSCLLILFIFITHGLSNAQAPKIDVTFKEAMHAQKAKHYRQMMLCEKMKTANQEDYDITYYSLDLTPDPATATLNGIVEVVGEVTTLTLNHVELNFWDDMTITDLYRSDAPGTPLDYSRNDDILDVTLDRDYTQGESFRITVDYTGRPGDFPNRYFNFDTYLGEPMIWTLSSVFGARIWWPCKDVPSDKPDSVDIRVTVPEDLIVASNGLLRETLTIGNQKTYWWHEKYPIATYLVSLAIHPYEMHYDDFVYNGGADTMEIQFYNFPGNYDANAPINNLVDDILACYSELYGEYPFIDEKYGQADFLWSGGMEHQTCTSYGGWSEVLYAHEIAHQWWGDMITCDSFHHIWLNEGFASYSEALWFEYAYPPFSASEYQMVYQLYLGPGTVYVEDPENENIFDSNLSYVKGSWVLHMLRHVVGDECFFDILKDYYASSHKYGTATTEEFQIICERVSGMDLDKFFHQWIYEENFPQYSYSWDWTHNGSDYNIQLEIQQEQTNPIFWMPIDVTVTTSSGETTFVIWDSLATQSFLLSVSSEPLNVELDKDDWVLKRIREDFVNPTFDRGILLVNGVLFESYDAEIRNSYENRAFWGDAPIHYWDCFYPPPTGYPSTLPDPIGFGKVPGDILGQFSTVIWVGNNYAGDLGSWQQTSILPYLEAGGNVILMTRLGQDYVDDDLRRYLGITWAEDPASTINNCIATHPGLGDMALTGSQSYNAVFETDLNDTESTLLFQETVSFGTPRGLGVWRRPQAGGTLRSNGGQFVFISGRPYRYDPIQLRRNVEFILQNFFLEGAPDGSVSTNSFLEQNVPNPFSTSTMIRYYLANPSDVKLTVYDILGRKIRSLLDDQSLTMGYHNAVWDGKDTNGISVGSGFYIIKMETPESSGMKKMILIK